MIFMIAQVIKEMWSHQLLQSTISTLLFEMKSLMYMSMIYYFSLTPYIIVSCVAMLCWWKYRVWVLPEDKSIHGLGIADGGDKSEPSRSNDGEKLIFDSNNNNNNNNNNSKVFFSSAKHDLVSRGIDVRNTKSRLMLTCASHLDELFEGAIFKMSTSSKRSLKLKHIKLSKDARYLEWPRAWFKTKKTGRIDLKHIARIQRGHTTRFFETMSDELHDYADTSFSLIYGNSSCRSVDIVAASAYMCNVWFNGLSCLINELQDKSQQSMSPQNKYINEKWNLADSDGNCLLTKQEILTLVHAMNISLPKKDILHIYSTVDVDQSGTLIYQEFAEFMRILLRRDDLVNLWRGLSAHLENQSGPTVQANEALAMSSPLKTVAITNKDVISWRTFSAFWSSNQKESTSDFVSRMSGLNIDGFTHDESPPFTLSFGVFCDIMNFSIAFNPAKRDIYQDMTRPLHDYFIATSHNTYLTGDQVQSHSSYQRYIDDLVSGCRCVEIDCWDGSELDNFQPVVYHGHTLTSKVMFRDVIKACAQYAFASSPYPIILSLENHCSLDQQKLMAEIMKAEFGAALLRPGELIVGGVLPSPEQLKHRVVIKGKRPQWLSSRVSTGTGAGKVEYVLSDQFAGDAVNDDDEEDEEGEEDEEEGDDDEDDDASDEEQPGRKEGPTVTSVSPTKKSFSISLSTRNVKKEHQVHPALAAITFLKAINLRDIIKCEATMKSLPADVILSCSERNFQRVMADDRVAGLLKNLCRNHLIRFYPKASRITSSNMDPIPMWAMGGQCAALNYQTAGLRNRLNHSKFLENGQCGYVAKPISLMNSSTEATDKSIAMSEKVRLTIRVISAQMLPKPEKDLQGEVIDPYVTLQVFGGGGGASASSPTPTSSTVKTSTVTDNGFNPQWNEAFTFDISHPEDCFLYLTVMDEDGVLEKDDFIAFSAVPISCLLEGYRHFQLYGAHGTRRGDYEYATLFSHIQIETITGIRAGRKDSTASPTPSRRLSPPPLFKETNCLLTLKSKLTSPPPGSVSVLSVSK